MSEEFDGDGNGYLDAERNAVKSIAIYGKRSKKRAGIEFFPKLRTPSCEDSGLTELDVSARIRSLKLCGATGTS